jgi:hypothetical protein
VVKDIMATINGGNVIGLPDPPSGPFDARPPVRPELVRVGWVRCETEVMS